MRLGGSATAEYSPTVGKWERIYYEEGKEALYIEKRGRASKVGTKKLENLKMV